jgi:hypothetical protein
VEKATEPPTAFASPVGISFDDFSPAPDRQALLYVGLSRARVRLVIVATEATMERVGGGAGQM